jgi:hypothetical protein
MILSSLKNNTRVSGTQIICIGKLLKKISINHFLIYERFYMYYNKKKTQEVRIQPYCVGTSRAQRWVLTLKNNTKSFYTF